MSEKKSGSRELNKSPSVSSLIAPPTPGEHVFRVQLKTANGKFLSVEHTHLVLPKSESGGIECVFEFHRISTAPPRYAVRSPLGRFLNVDDSIELVNKDKVAKDLGPKADRDGGEGGANLTEREKSFEIIEVAGGIAIRTPDEFFLACEPGETKIKLTKNASYVPPANATATLAPATSTSSLASGVAAPAASSSATAAPYATLSAALGEVFIPTWVDERSPLTLAGRYLLRTAHGMLCCVEPDGNVVANRLQPSFWAPLEIVSSGLAHVAFRTVHGMFLTPQRSERQLVEGTAEVLGEDERFEVILLDKLRNTYAFKAATGKFVCAQGNHTVTASSKHCGAWETFTLVPCPPDA